MQTQLNIRWRWLPALPAPLLIGATVAPLSGAVKDILMLLALAGLLVPALIDSPAFRKEAAVFTISVTVLVLLALLLSINPKPVLFGCIAVYLSTPLWEMVRNEHAEYVTERESRSLRP